MAGVISIAATTMAYWLNSSGSSIYYANEGFYDTDVDDNDVEYREANDGQPLPRKGEETQFVPKVSLAYHFGKDR